MIAFLRAVGALWRVALAEMMQYRGEIVLWAVWGIVYPAVALTMWTAAIAGTQGAGEIGGFAARDFAAYFLMTMVVGHLITAWDAYEMGWLVRSGRLSAALLRPILPLWKSVGDNVAYKALTLVILVPIWLGFAWVTGPKFSTTPAQAGLGGAALLLAAALSYVWGYNIALLAFWTTRTDAVAEFWFGAGLVFGGRLAPLGLLPGPLRLVADVLPFKWLMWFPVELLMGRIPAGEALAGLLAQAGWLLTGAIVFRVLWRIGLRRYSAVGA